MNEQKKWIWLRKWSEIEQTHPKVVFFRKTIFMDKKVVSAKIHVSADSRYRLYVNGHPVGFGPLKGDAYRWYADLLDITPYLMTGKNVISAVVLRYPPIPRIGNESVWRTATPCFLVQGQLLFDDGTQMPIDTDETWHAKRAEHIGIRPDGGLNFLWIREETTGDASLINWTMPEFLDNEWEETVVIHSFFLPESVSPGSVADRPVPLMFETARCFNDVVCLRTNSQSRTAWENLITSGTSVFIAPHSEEIVEINAGELTTGFLELSLIGGKGSKIEILTSECYAYQPEDPKSRYPLPRKGDRTDWKNGQLYGMTDEYIPHGSGTDDVPEIYEPFWFRTFRFVSIRVVTGFAPLTIKSFTYRETGYPLNAQTVVRTSSDELADIWSISLRTLRRCMHETYEDCPFYEQLQYAMDTRSQILFTYAVSADDRLARKCIDDFHRSQYPEGLVSSCYPAYGHNIIPSFSLYYLLMLHDHMMYFGDKEFIKQYIPTMDGILSFFDTNRTLSGIVNKTGGPLGSKYWSFVDWTKEWRSTFGVPPATFKGPVTYESLLYAYVLKSSAEVVEYVGRPEQAEEYRERAENMLDAVKGCCRGSSGMFQDGPGIDDYSQHCQVMAVLSGAVTGKEAQLLMVKTLDDPSLTKCSVAMAYYLFRAVEQTGLYDRTEALWQPWRDMLANHLTTCVEDPVSGRSDCHAWGAIALYEIPSVLLGVRPARPGYEAVKIAPNPGMLSWAEGTVITPKGMVTVSWKKTNDGLDIQYKVPYGMDVVD